MNNPKLLSIQDYTYFLPDSRIASYPLAERDASKLLVYKKGTITEDRYANIANHLPAESLLVFNNTKVVEARLLFQKPSGGNIEIFCLQPTEQYNDTTSAMLETGSVLWQCLVGGASKWKHGQVLEKKLKFPEQEIVLQARYIEKRTEYFIIELSWSPAQLSFAEILHHTGAIPLPPYIKRAVESSDIDRYQTVYAHFDGSVAAPTAGLHFTDGIFKKLAAGKIEKEFVTLHVGAGTFKPVKAEVMEAHEMHAEFFEVTKQSIKNILRQLGKPIVAVGTTSLRTLESLYWMGVKILDNNGHHADLLQWEVYEMIERNIPVDKALQTLLTWMEKIETFNAKTKIIIAPGYQFKIVNALITNFHQPQSTLLLLVAALIGEDWQLVYDYAMKNEFRFLSYGDGSLLWLNSTLQIHV